MSKEYYINADQLIETIKTHKEHVKTSHEDDWRYALAHDHIIDLVELAKKDAIVLER